MYILYDIIMFLKNKDKILQFLLNTKLVITDYLFYSMIFYGDLKDIIIT